MKLGLVILPTTILAVAPQNPFKCSNIVIDGTRYDLSSLNKFRGLSMLPVLSNFNREWVVEGNIPLRFNPCEAINYNNDACPKGASFMCAMDPKNPSVGRANIGTPTELFRNPKGELVTLYSRGGFDLNGFPFISLVRYECDKNATKEHGPLEAINDGTKYFLIWKTKAACPVSASVSFGGGSILLWIIVIITIYLIGGCLYNYAVQGKTGTDMIPNKEFWIDIRDFIVELFSNIKARLSGRSGGYQQI